MTLHKTPLNSIYRKIKNLLVNWTTKIMKIQLTIGEKALATSNNNCLLLTFERRMLSRLPRLPSRTSGWKYCPRRRPRKITALPAPAPTTTSTSSQTRASTPRQNSSVLWAPNLSKFSPTKRGHTWTTKLISTRQARTGAQYAKAPSRRWRGSGSFPRVGNGLIAII